MHALRGYRFRRRRYPSAARPVPSRSKVEKSNQPVIKNPVRLDRSGPSRECGRFSTDPHAVP